MDTKGEENLPRLFHAAQRQTMTPRRGGGQFMRRMAQFMAKPIHAADGNSFFTKDIGKTSVRGRHFEGFPSVEGEPAAAPPSTVVLTLEITAFTAVFWQTGGHRGF